MDYFIICISALLASGVTLFSGFGLGTVLMPVFALFFPLSIAIAATAVVHLANNLFKLALVGRHANWGVVLRFSLPAALSAAFGASLLGIFAAVPAIASYELYGQPHEITVVKLVIGVLIITFALLELNARFAQLELPGKYVTLGGLVSGFFGGLSGNQGALRSAFLIKLGLSKEAFIATGVVSSVVVDTVRLLVYGIALHVANFSLLASEVGGIVIAASIAAFLGAYLGARLVHKVTLRSVQIITAIALVALGSALAIGLI